MSHQSYKLIPNQKCHSLTQEGLGVVQLDSGKVAFVEGLLPDECADLMILKEKKSFSIAKVVDLKQISPNRVEPSCELAHICGGCTVQHLNYRTQLEWKENIVRQNLQRIGGFSKEQIDAKLRPILGMKDYLPRAYRNKVQLPCQASTTSQKTLEIGYFAKQSHQIVPHETCLLQPQLADILTKEIRSFWQNQNTLWATQKTKTSLLRHLLLRFGRNTGQVMVVLVLNTNPHDTQYANVRPILQKLAAHLEAVVREQNAELKSVYANFQTAPPPAILGEKLDLLWGETHIQEKLGDFIYNISPHSFFQVNTEQTEVLYQKVLEEAELQPTDEVFDLYCGTGSISLFLAKKAKHVTGIEIVPPAIEDAIQNAAQNNLSAKTTFLCGAAEILGPKLCDEGQRPNIIVLDPPRKGCDAKLLQAVCEMAPERIVYVSCDPATLARDLKWLANPDSHLTTGNKKLSTYHIESITPVDLFPHTMHVETVVALTKNM